MNSQFLIRIAASALAATALLTAQSAPVARTKASDAKAEAVSTERLQVRLAEVIAMLEEDDLTAEQREQAKKKLQEISAKLKSVNTKASNPIAVAPGSHSDGIEVRGKVVGVAPSASDQVHTVTVDGKKVAFVHEPSKSDHGIAVVPGESKKYTAKLEAASGGEPQTFDIVVAPEAAQDPAPAKAPKTPKAPKAPKALKAPKTAPEPAEAPAELEVVEVEKADSRPLRVRRVTAEGDKEEAARALRVHEEALRKHAAELRASAGELRAAHEENARPRVLRLRQVEGQAAAEAVREHHELLERARRAEVEGDLAKAHALRSGQMAERVRDHAEATKRYAKLEAEAKAQAESEAAVDQAVAAKLYRSRADTAKKAQSQVKSRSRAAEAEDEAKAGASVKRRALLDLVEARAHEDDDGDDDREIRKLIDEMRAEMRQIRALLQDLRKQAQAPRGRTPGQDRAPTNSALGGSGGAFALGRSGASAFGGGFGAGAGTGEPGQILFGSPGSGASRGSWNLFAPSQGKKAFATPTPFPGGAGAAGGSWRSEAPGQTKDAPGKQSLFLGGSTGAGGAKSTGEAEGTEPTPEPIKRSAGAWLSR